MGNQAFKTAAIYARVSSQQQKGEGTLANANQTAALLGYAAERGFAVPEAWVFQDEGYSGGSLARPALEQLRELAAQGEVEMVLVHSPDRLARKDAHRVLLVEELARSGVALIFLES